LDDCSRYARYRMSLIQRQQDDLTGLDPRRLPGLSGWWDAAHPNGFGVALPVDGTPLGIWTDLSGLGHDVTAVTLARRPTWHVGAGRPYLNFDGVDDYLTLPGYALGGTGVSMYAATASSASTGANQSFVAIGGQASGSYWKVQNSGAGSTSVSVNFFTGVGVSISSNLINSFFDSNQHVLDIHSGYGINIGNTKDAAGPADKPTFTYGGMTLQGTLNINNSTTPYPCTMNALLFFNVLHDKFQRRRVMNWLSMRYGPTLTRP
jgi:hypothetical protein